MSDTEFLPTRHVVPVLRGQNRATVTPPWFVNHSEYTPKLATFRPLVNGEEAFGDVYRAIEGAKTSVCIICWGFQPSMYFVRNGQALMIGQLLEQKARDGVMVRVLCWALTSALTVNVTGAKGEPNTPGRQIVSYKGRPATSTDQQYAYDVQFYSIYDRKQSAAGELRREYFVSDSYPKEKLIFSSRSFSTADQWAIATMNYTDKDVSANTRMALTVFATHHQKMVVVDYEHPDAAVGFVMGHNMLDEYWDTSDHGWQRHAANAGRNGSLPRHDYSSRVTGPIVGDLFRNFSTAWQLETGEALTAPDFNAYPLRGDDAKAVCQILRTQVHFGKRQDIKTCYLQAVSNASQYIHIENQYFRWPPLAERIKQSAAKQAAWGRTPEQNGSLYLFVITNTSDDGMGDGTVNTYRMLESLGRADTIPEVARTARLEDIDKQLDQNRKAMKPLLGQRNALDEQARLLNGMGGQDLNDRYARINDRLGPLEERQKQLEESRKRLAPLSEQERKEGSSRTPEPIQQADVPGLKVLVATLVATDTPAGKPWQEVYIHAKLMLIDDTFMTLGSANINTRSMQTDSELNIAHHRPEITGPLRRQQWDKYTSGRTAGLTLKDAYMEWQKIMTDNATFKSKRAKPIAQLAEFLRTSDKITNTD